MSGLKYVFFKFHQMKLNSIFFSLHFFKLHEVAFFRIFGFFFNQKNTMTDIVGTA